MNTLERLIRILRVADPDTFVSLRDLFVRWCYSSAEFNEEILPTKNGLPKSLELQLLLRLPHLEEIYAEELVALSQSAKPEGNPASPADDDWARFSRQEVDDEDLKLDEVDSDSSPGPSFTALIRAGKLPDTAGWRLLASELDAGRSGSSAERATPPALKTVQ